jgi:hypothetical protein
MWNVPFGTRSVGLLALYSACILRLHRGPGLVGDLYLDDRTRLILSLNHPSCRLNISFDPYHSSFGIYCRFSLPHLRLDCLLPMGTFS